MRSNGSLPKKTNKQTNKKLQNFIRISVSLLVVAQEQNPHAIMQQTHFSLRREETGCSGGKRSAKRPAAQSTLADVVRGVW